MALRVTVRCYRVRYLVVDRAESPDLRRTVVEAVWSASFDNDEHIYIYIYIRFVLGGCDYPNQNTKRNGGAPAQ